MLTENGASMADAVITPETMLPDLLRTHPEARVVLDGHGLHGCGGRFGPHETIRYFARVHGVDEGALLREIGQAIDGTAHPSGSREQTQGGVADTLYRRYFLGGIMVTLTAGATWGAWLLWNVALGGSFRAISVSSVNAHGEAQIFGWVGLFIMGFAYQAFPRLWQTQLVWPRLAAVNFWLMVAGIILRTVGTAVGGEASWGLGLAMVGGGLEVASVAVFVSQIVLSFRRSGAAMEPYAAFVLAALGWFVASTAMSVWHGWNTMTATDQSALIWAIATYQSPLRDLQIHGLALFMILGVSLRMVPRMFDTPATPDRWAWWGFALLLPAVFLEIALFLSYRWTRSLYPAMALIVPWTAMIVAAGLVVAPWKLWRPIRERDRVFKFVRAAYLWLFIALVMLLLTPAYQTAVATRVTAGMRISHAYMGATRHAITVGFISLMIMGMAAKVVPTLNGVDHRRLSRLWGPFLLLNVGCGLRVITQVLTDWYPAIYPILGVSGTLEVIGIAWWGAGLALIIVRGYRDLRAGASEIGPRPQRIEPDHRVGDILEWFPDTLPVFLARGFSLLKNPRLRRVMASQVTLARAAAMRGVSLDELVEALNVAIGPSKSAKEKSPLPSLTVLAPADVLELERSSSSAP